MQNLKFLKHDRNWGRHTCRETFTKLQVVIDLVVLDVLSYSLGNCSSAVTSAELDKGECPLSRDGDFLQPNEPVCIAGVIAHSW